MNKVLTKFFAFWKSYTSLFLLPILLFIFIRVLEYCLLIENVQSLTNSFRSFTYSVEFDLIFVALYYLIFLVFFFVLYIISKKLYQFTFYTFLIILTFIYLALNQFFYTSNILLDKTVFFFSWEEMKIILGGESGEIFGTFFWIYFTALLIIILGIWIVHPRLKTNKKLRIASQLITLTSLSLFIFRGDIHPKNLKKYSYYETQLHTSKLTYFFSSLESFFSNENFNAYDKIKYIKDYRSMIGRDGYFEKLDLPFVHRTKDLKKNHWNEYIEGTDKIKNVVIIFAEGLSSQFSGEEAKFGSMTPFLDSLSKKSLYWPNMLSITDRTHGVFAASLAGLPHGFERGFLNYNGDKPNYNSIPKILKKQGYSLNFFYGGWSYFDNYRTFLEDNEFDSIIDEEYIKQYFNLVRSNSNDEFSWGLHDHATVDAYFKFMDQHKPSSPYLNLYLTLSLHTPYDIPEKAQYIEASKKNLSHLNPEFFEANKDVISAVYYADQSLQKFFKRYSKRKDFEETIFLIMGDHSVKAMDLHSELGTYHVPFILYSPKIINPKKFNDIISHWDVPATLFDILPTLNWSDKGDYTSWLGNGVSLEDKLSAKEPIFLGTFQGEIIGVVWKNYAYIHERLYRIQKGLQLELYDNEKKARSMKNLLTTYTWLNRYSIEEDKIITKHELLE